MVNWQPIPLPEALRFAVDQWAVGTLAASILWTRGLGRAAVLAAQRQRLICQRGCSLLHCAK